MKNPVTFWLLLLAYVAFVAGLCFYFPYDAARLYRAIPSNATFVSAHDDLAARWPELARHPLAAALAGRAFGMSDAEIAGLPRNAMINGWLGQLACRKTVCAYVPAMGRSGQPAWVVVSWVGGRAQFQKAWLMFHAGKGMRRVDVGDGRWAWQVKAAPGRPAWTFTWIEGVWVGCYSADPQAISHMFRRMDHRLPLHVELAQWLKQPPAAKDHGWVTFPLRGGDWEWPWLRFEVVRMAPAELALRVDGYAGNLVGQPSADAGLEAMPEGVMRLLGAAPAMCWRGTVQDLKNMRARPEESWMGILDHTNVVADGRAFIAVLDHGHSGHVFGVRSPSLVAGLQLRDPGQARQMITESLDALNARYGLGLMPLVQQVPAAQGAEPRLMVGMDSAQPAVPRRPPDEWPALTVVDDWLILAAHREVLTALLAATNTAPTARMAWVLSSQSGDRRLWVDIASLAEVLQGAVALCDLQRYATGSASGWRTPLEELRLALESMKPFRHIVVSYVSKDGQVSGDVRLGPDLPR